MNVTDDLPELAPWSCFSPYMLEDRTMEMWRKVWREGFLPQFNDDGLFALRAALERQDPRILQGTTCYPPLLDCLRERDVEACCPVGFAGWQGGEADTVDQLDRWFSRVCDDCDKKFNEPAACRYLLNYWDDAPRAEACRQLLEEVERELANRKAVA